MQLKFLGHREGIQADPDKTTAITEMTAPTNVLELHQFIGIVNQLGKYSLNCNCSARNPAGYGALLMRKHLLTSRKS